MTNVTCRTLKRDEDEIQNYELDPSWNSLIQVWNNLIKKKFFIKIDFVIGIRIKIKLKRKFNKSQPISMLCLFNKLFYIPYYP